MQKKQKTTTAWFGSLLGRQRTEKPAAAMLAGSYSWTISRINEAE